MSTKITIEANPIIDVEADAWATKTMCVGPKYGEIHYGKLPIQSIQLGYYSHEKLYLEKTVIGLMKAAYYKGYNNEELERLRTQLAEREAQLAGGTSTLAYYANSISIYVDAGVANAAAETLNQLPASAKLNAEILRAAEDWRDAIEERDRAYDDGMPPWTYANKAAKAEKALLPAGQAVRAKKAGE